jgi:protein-S-isoprenylcysteine O-methyltransferase Ste14
VLPLYVTDGWAAVVFWTLFVLWAVAERVTFERLRGVPRDRARDRGSLVVLVVAYWTAILVGFGVALAMPSAAITWQRHLLFDLGTGFLLGGLVLRQYAIITLGHLHTLDVTTRTGQPVVEAGPYRWIRHPSYAGSLLTAAGILLCSTNWLSLACCLLVIGGYAYRIRVEERALAEDLGNEYRGYMRRTKRLIPFLL